jgi:hypothetical protein
MAQDPALLVLVGEGGGRSTEWKRRMQRLLATCANVVMLASR